MLLLYIDCLVFLTCILLACFLNGYYLFIFIGYVLIRQCIEWFYPWKLHVQGKHVFITGGSSGLGLALAKYYLRNGAKVTIIARDIKKLQIAKSELVPLTNDTTAIVTESCDVTKYDEVKKTIEKCIQIQGQPIDHLICAAGLCVPGFLANQPIQIHKDTMEINYFGVLNTIKAALNAITEHAVAIKDECQKPKICIIASALGLFGFIGETSYAPTKFALRGLAETLHNELISYGIKVHIFFPGNIDTPGFEAENKIKPAISKKLEEGSAVSSPESVCDCLLQGMARGQHAIVNEIGVGILRMASGGIMPRTNVFYELMMLPLVTIIGLVYHSILDYQVRGHNK